MEYKYYLAQLKEQDSLLYQFIYNKILACTNSFLIASSTYDIDRIMKYIMLDNPNLYWFEGKWKAVYKDNLVCVIPIYKKRNYDQKIHDVISTVLNDCNGSKIDHIKTIYDWILNNVQYCNTNNDQTIKGVLIDKKAVCKGISKAFQYFMNLLDIPSYLIEGTIDGFTPHVWNVIYINNKYYHIDISIGYPQFSKLFNGLNRNRHYPCFMVSDQTIRTTHKIYKGYDTSCNEDYDFDQYLVNTLHIPEQLKKYGSYTYLDKGSTSIVLKTNQNESEYVLKVMQVKQNIRMFHASCLELEKMKILKDCKGIIQFIDGVILERRKTVYILSNYYKPLSVRRRERDFIIVEHTIKLGIDILKCLIECRNKGIYHLDIQPKNIYFDRDNKAILGDFGNSVFEYELSTLQPKRGTLAFMAPEVYHKGIYGQASEIYSLGIVLYSLLNHARLPFSNHHSGKNAIRIRLYGEELPPLNVDQALWNCIKRMCAYNVDIRFHSFEDVLLELEELYKRLK